MDRRSFLKNIALAGTGAVLASAGWTPSSAQATALPVTGRAAANILIAYLTRTNNTKAVAELIQQAVGGTMVEVEPETPYPEDYDAIVAQVDRENDAGYTPPLRGTVPTLQDYDTVFVGFPTWDMQMPPPMKRFVEDHDLSGKTVIPFNTNAGYGVGSSFQTIADACPDSNVLRGFSTRGGIERDGIYLAIKGERRQEVRAEVTDWLQRIQPQP